MRPENESITTAHHCTGVIVMIVMMSKSNNSTVTVFQISTSVQHVSVHFAFFRIILLFKSLRLVQHYLVFLAVFACS